MMAKSDFKLKLTGDPENLTPEQRKALEDASPELEALQRYLQKGFDRTQQQPLSIEEYMQGGGDAVIFWDLFEDDFTKVIETRPIAALPGLRNVLKLLKSNFDKDLKDPFMPQKPPYLGYAISIIDKLMVLVDIRLETGKPQKRPSKPDITFDSLFNSDGDKRRCIEWMKQLHITDSANKFKLTGKRKSGLMGFIHALRDNNIITYHSEAILLDCFCKFLSIPYTRLKSESDTFKRFKKDTEKLIESRRIE